MGNHDFCEDCGASDFHQNTRCPAQCFPIYLDRGFGAVVAEHKIPTWIPFVHRVELYAWSELAGFWYEIPLPRYRRYAVAW